MKVNQSPPSSAQALLCFRGGQQTRWTYPPLACRYNRTLPTRFLLARCAEALRTAAANGQMTSPNPKAQRVLLAPVHRPLLIRWLPSATANWTLARDCAAPELRRRPNRALVC